MGIRWRLDLEPGISLVYADGVTMLLKSGRLKTSLLGSPAQMKRWAKLAALQMNALAGADDEVPFDDLSGLSAAVSAAVLFWEREAAK